MPFNVLVNYWWTSSPASHSDADACVVHTRSWTIRDRPEREKQAWREVFDYYVFGAAGRSGEHLPEPARNLLRPDRRNPRTAVAGHDDRQSSIVEVIRDRLA
jgi:hypothetical protein